MDVRTSWKYFFGLATLTVLVGSGISAASNSGITIHSGTLDMSGNDIEDAGTTIWDASNGYVPEGQIQQGFGSGLDADKLDGNNASSFVEVDGDKMTGDLTISEINTGGSGSLTLAHDTNQNNDFLRIQSNKIEFSDFGHIDDSLSTGQMALVSDGALRIDAGNDGDEDCKVENDGSLDCTGTKNWVHQLNTTHEAVYTSQESPMVRSVYEGNTTVTSGRVNVSLPSHFEKTVSDSKPMLRVQATPHSLATVAVTERSDSWIVIEASKDVHVDYRVTGIREEYEDKQVVRETNVR